MSRNPFMQTFEAEFNKQAQLIDMSATMKESPKKATFGDDARDLFVRPCSPVTAGCAALHQQLLHITFLYRALALDTYPHPRASHGSLQALCEQVC
jgi:hypothetical protein